MTRLLRKHSPPPYVESCCYTLTILTRLSYKFDAYQFQMNRYILFAGNSDIPNGGFDDYVGSRSTVNALKKLALTCHVGGNGKLPKWAHIVDVTTMSRLCSLDGDAWTENVSSPATTPRL